MGLLCLFFITKRIDDEARQQLAIDKQVHRINPIQIVIRTKELANKWDPPFVVVLVPFYRNPHLSPSFVIPVLWLNLHMPFKNFIYITQRISFIPFREGAF